MALLRINSAFMACADIARAGAPVDREQIRSYTRYPYPDGTPRRSEFIRDAFLS
jgi:hypothetical protein